MSRKLITGITIGLCCAWSSASDASAKAFGEAGAWTPGGALELSRTADSDGGMDDTVLAVGPELMYFVLENLAIGTALAFEHASGSGYDAMRYGVAPAIGYNVQLTDTASLFPTLSIGAGIGRSEYDIVTKTEVDETRYWTGISIPLLVHLGNFHIGFGPYLQVASVRRETLIDTGTLFSGFAPEGTHSRDDSVPTWDEDISTLWEVGLRSVVGGTF